MRHDVHVSAIVRDGAVRAQEVHGVDALFDAHASAVFVTACHITVGDRRRAEELLTSTFVGLQRSSAGRRFHIDRADLLVDVAQRYLASVVTTEHVREPVEVAPFHSDDWSRTHWSDDLAALDDLAPVERVALALHDTAGLAVPTLALALQQTEQDMSTTLEAARCAVAASAVDPIDELFRHTELWLDDITRDAVRAAMRAERPTRGGPAAARVGRTVPRLTRGQRWACVAAACSAAVVALVVHWVRDAPETDGTPIRFTLPTGANSSPTSSVTAPSSAALAESDTARPLVEWSTSMAFTDDTSPETFVTLDSIVRYDDDTVGLSWHGPCDRPAAGVTFATSGAGVGVRLSTGPMSGVVSCTGMPERWSAVVYLAHIVEPGATIVPMAMDGTLDTDFAGYATARAPMSLSAEDAAAEQRATGFSSALIDANNQPWVHTSPCTEVHTIRYVGPDGAAFRVVTKGVETAPDGTDCSTGRQRTYLLGPTGTFPQARPYAATPADCHGPYGSMTDVLPEPSVSERNHDQPSWSTWDGCRVDGDVIYTRHLAADCGWGSVSTITVDEVLGTSIGRTDYAVTYVHDPDRVLPGDQPPLYTMNHLPATAYDTGLRRGTDQLWLMPDETSGVYVRAADGTVEHWPRVDTAPTC